MNLTLLTEQDAERIAERATLSALAKLEEKISARREWMTIREVCDYLNLSETKVRELIKQGFPVSTVGGDKRFYRPDVDRFMRGVL